MTGASMLMKGLMDLIQRIAVITMPDQATSILSLISPLRTFIGYGIAGVGVMVQLAILKETTVEVRALCAPRDAYRVLSCPLKGANRAGDIRADRVFRALRGRSTRSR